MAMVHIRALGLGYIQIVPCATGLIWNSVTGACVPALPPMPLPPTVPPGYNPQTGTIAPGSSGNPITGSSVPCPSLKQAQGIIDPTDPCQSQPNWNADLAGSTIAWCQANPGSCDENGPFTSSLNDFCAAVPDQCSLVGGSPSLFSGMTGVYLALAALFIVVLATGGRR